MDAVDILLLLAGFLGSALYFEWRVRRFIRNASSFAFQRVLSAFLVKQVSKAEDGTEREIWALSARGRAIVAAGLTAVVPEVLAWAKANVKVKAPAGGGFSLPEGASLGMALGPILGGFVQGFLPKGMKGMAPQIGAALGSYVEPLLAGLGKQEGAAAAAKPAGKGGTNPFLKELTP